MADESKLKLFAFAEDMEGEQICVDLSAGAVMLLSSEGLSMVAESLDVFVDLITKDLSELIEGDDDVANDLPGERELARTRLRYAGLGQSERATQCICAMVAARRLPATRSGTTAASVSILTFVPSARTQTVRRPRDGNCS